MEKIKNTLWRSILVPFVGVIALTSTSFGQETAADSTKSWTIGGVTSFNFNQVSLTNWAAGGESSVAGGALFSLGANYKKNGHSWNNQLDLAFGVVQQGENPIQKTDDRMEFTSIYGRKIKEKVDLSALFNFRSQFAPGFNLPNDSVRISEFLAPGYVQTAVGFDFKEKDKYTFFFGPISYRATIVMNQTLANAGAFGVQGAVTAMHELGQLVILTPGENIRHEFGGTFRGFYRTQIMENITFQTQLQLFSNYLESPQNIDVLWDVLISMKVNKYITASIATNLIYDDDIRIEDSNGNFGPRTQFKQVLAVGFAYNFGNRR
ncbi:MAG: DUF3078 domain-containing protein [Luteibaculaceae bacterium]